MNASSAGYFEMIPENVLLNITHYVSIRDLYRTFVLLNKGFNKLFQHDLLFLSKLITSRFFFNNPQVFEQITALDSKRLKESLRNLAHAGMPLPFSGISTNGGSSYQLPQFSVVLAFSQSMSSSISLKKHSHAIIEGYLTQQAIYVPQILQKFMMLFQEVNKIHPITDSFVVYYNTSVQDVDIGALMWQVFQIDSIIAYFKSINIPQPLLIEIIETGRLIFNVDQSILQLIKESSDQPVIALDSFFSKLRFCQSLIQQVHISRRGPFRKPVKTLMVYAAYWPDITYETQPEEHSQEEVQVQEINETGMDSEELKKEQDVINNNNLNQDQYQRPQYKIVNQFEGSHTMNDLLRIVQENEKDVQISRFYCDEFQNQICVFQQKNDDYYVYQPILWLQFEGGSQEIVVPLAAREKQIGNNAIIHIINSENDQYTEHIGTLFYESLVKGTCFSFVSLRGRMFYDDSICNYEEMLQSLDKILQK